jgi:predicted Zn-dependent protease
MTSQLNLIAQEYERAAEKVDSLISQAKGCRAFSKTGGGHLTKEGWKKRAREILALAKQERSKRTMAWNHLVQINGWY